LGCSLLRTAGQPPSSYVPPPSDLKRPGNERALIQATENYWFSIWGEDYALN